MVLSTHLVIPEHRLPVAAGQAQRLVHVGAQDYALVADPDPRLLQPVGHLAVATSHHHVDAPSPELLVQLPTMVITLMSWWVKQTTRIHHQALGLRGSLYQQRQHPALEVGR